MKVLRQVFLPILLALLAAACSTTKNLPEGEQLYIGMGKTQILRQDKSHAGQQALTEVESTLKVTPNGAIFGSASASLPKLPFGLWLYNSFVRDSTVISKWIFDKFAAKPVFISQVKSDSRAKVATNILREHGYFDAEVKSSVTTLKKDSLKAKVSYTVDMASPYHYDSIVPLPISTFPDSILAYRQTPTLIQKGDQFNLAKLHEERQTISALLRDNGYYYFRPQDIIYEADTLLVRGAVCLRAKLSEDTPPQAMRPWKIGKRTAVLLGMNGEAPTDSLEVNDLKVLYYRKMPVRPKILAQRFRFFPGNLYRQKDDETTRKSLARLGAFSVIDLNFSQRDSTSDLLDVRLLTSLDKPWDASLETLFTSKSNDFIGPGLNFALARRNVFGGGENLSWNIGGSYEWETRNRPEGSSNHLIDINSYNVNTSVNLSFPSIVFPGLLDKYYYYPTTTTFQASATALNRAHYFSMYSFGFSTTYEFQPSKEHRHAIFPLKLNYNLLGHQTETFQTITANNPPLLLSLQSQFLAQMGYVYTFNKSVSEKSPHHLWMQFGLSEAGNLLNLIYLVAGKKYSDTKNFIGVPFSQFIKATGELRYTYTIDRNQSLATRFGSGVIYSYGNMRVAPYSEQFYVGGANSIRAFTVRSIGPGRFNPDEDNLYSYLDQVGEFKLEANVEYRGKLFGDLHAAVFLDAGNVWLLREDPSRPGGALSEAGSISNFLNSIALGTGVGLRYDLAFLVVRVDVGFGLHLPYDTGKKGYYNIPRFKDAVGFHLAVGYPF
ncbi:BamA/TamA family outer membrane protein [Porphyromonas gulae]|uniref:translocation and assembly module lipoprotein TamL n=1 Tax=Porphyromonas gulae TaxID=111105 RepID=UPI00242E379C|nr:BamA/TamA family outer membrane protein [Porphyromonas gulae]